MKDLANLNETIAVYGKKILRHHPIIAILAVLGVMILCVFRISQIITLPEDQAYRSEKQATSVRTNFDKETIKKIDLLTDRQSSSPSLPDGRINPFVE